MVGAKVLGKLLDGRSYGEIITAVYIVCLYTALPSIYLLLTRKVLQGKQQEGSTATQRGNVQYLPTFILSDKNRFQVLSMLFVLLLR
jgi:hypothetical protein